MGFGCFIDAIWFNVSMGNSHLRGEFVPVDRDYRICDDDARFLVLVGFFFFGGKFNGFRLISYSIE